MTTVTTRKAKALNSEVLPNLSEADSVKVKSFAVNNAAPVALTAAQLTAAAEAGVLSASTNGQALTISALPTSIAANVKDAVTAFKGAAAAVNDILMFDVVHPNGGTLSTLGTVVPDFKIGIVALRLTNVGTGTEAFDTNVTI
jgi:hypothetical protein